MLCVQEYFRVSAVGAPIEACGCLTLGQVCMNSADLQICTERPEALVPIIRNFVICAEQAHILLRSSCPCCLQFWPNTGFIL